MIDLNNNSMTIQAALQEIVMYVENNILNDDPDSIRIISPRSIMTQEAKKAFGDLKCHLFDDEKLFRISVIEQHLLVKCIREYLSDSFGDEDYQLLDRYALEDIRANAGVMGIRLEAVEVKKPMAMASS